MRVLGAMRRREGVTSACRPGAIKYALLDPLRGLAALWVFTFHYPFGPWLQHGAPPLAVLFHRGFLGVPLFFVISGYCITGSARSSARRDEGPMRFLYRRLRRIYPTFWLSLIFAVAMPFWLELVSSLKTGHYVQPAPTLNNGFMHYSGLDWLSIVTLTRVFTHVPGATSLQYKFTSLNAVYWTLALEVQFYAVVALALYVGKRFYAALALITVVALPFAFIPHEFLTGIFLPYWPMFAVGVLVYWLLERDANLTRDFGRHARTAAGIATVAGAAGFVAYVALGGGVGELMVAIAFGAWLLVAHPLDRLLGGARLKPTRGLWQLPLKLLVVLGTMSYSLYLMHQKLYPIILQPVSQVLRSPSAVRDLLIIVLTGVATYGFYWFAERPFATPAPRPRADNTRGVIGSMSLEPLSPLRSIVRPSDLG